MADVLSLTGLSRQGLYAAMARGAWPQPLASSRGKGKRLEWDLDAVAKAMQDTTHAVRRFCEERQAAPLLVGCDRALIGCTVQRDVSTPVYDYDLCIAALVKRGMADPAAWLSSQQDVVMVQRPGGMASADTDGDAVEEQLGTDAEEAAAS
jgi:predicted DNA-binding transcriptional regulator AlpA